jgi:REP element-mobilizing transposase RayT
MEPNKTYHIYTHANGNENLFRIPENFRFFLKRYHDFVSPVADTYAYCLMPNHVHFLVNYKTEDALVATFGKFETFQKLETRISKQWVNLFSSYTQAFNKMYSRSGSPFAPNFKRKEIANQEYFKNVILYIHQNPIRHGFVSSLAEWPWTSFQAMLIDLPTRLKRKEVLELFGNSSEYIRFHNQPIPKEVMAEISA